MPVVMGVYAANTEATWENKELLRFHVGGKPARMFSENMHARTQRVRRRNINNAWQKEAGWRSDAEWWM